MRTSREIFKISGEPEEPEKIAYMKKAGRAVVEQIAKDPELEKILTGADFSLLRDLFEKIAMRSGVDPATLNFLGPDRIAHRSLSWSGTGIYNAQNNFIGISYDRVKERAKKLGLDPELTAVKTLCHEETHATSKVECTGENEPRDKYPYYRGDKTGYSRYIEGQEGVHEPYVQKWLFNRFNEGVTEKLSREIFLEYAIKSGKYPKEEIGKFELLERAAPEELSYGVAVGFVNALILKISRETGLDEKTVWRALIRGMYEGEDFQDQELKSLFAEIISPEFLDKLARAYSDDELDKLAVTFFMKHPAPDKKNRIRDRLRDFISNLGRKKRNK